MGWRRMAETVTSMRRACIDIGSNTTRLLVADCSDGSLVHIYEERIFTQVGRSRSPDGAISQAKIDEVAKVVAAQLLRARELGAGDVTVVATAAIRAAPNGASLAAGVHRTCGLEVQVLSWKEEARLAFIGVARTLDHQPVGDLAVVDVGGGSSELAVGTPPDRVSWSATVPLGSGDLARACLLSDPPASHELAEAKRRVDSALNAVEVPAAAEAVAVGGNAGSLARLVGTRLDSEAFTRSLLLLASHPAETVAHRLGLEVERVRLMPTGLLILQGAGERFGVPLLVGCGGLREGVLLETGRG
jgi:exopolyphosphatase / guanosine-5'-triphosphate,3'-diphosphate pyrophosphatase